LGDYAIIYQQGQFLRVAHAVGSLDEGRDPERPVRDQALTTVAADGPANGRIAQRRFSPPRRGSWHVETTKSVNEAAPVISVFLIQLSLATERRRHA
jgi:hypothetical protein